MHKKKTLQFTSATPFTTLFINHFNRKSSITFASNIHFYTGIKASVSKPLAFQNDRWCWFVLIPARFINFQMSRFLSRSIFFSFLLTLRLLENVFIMFPYLLNSLCNCSALPVLMIILIRHPMLVVQFYFAGRLELILKNIPAVSGVY